MAPIGLMNISVIFTVLIFTFKKLVEVKKDGQGSLHYILRKHSFYMVYILIFEVPYNMSMLLI